MFYHGSLGMLAVLSGLALAPTREKPRPQPLNSDACVLEYQRADNMWAAPGRPDGNLGTETVTFTGWKDFKTDWTYEKQRNDGVHFYGSHLRVATNRGTRQVVLWIISGIMLSEVGLQPGQSQQFHDDLRGVDCK
jgi:hypothetical protein